MNKYIAAITLSIVAPVVAQAAAPDAPSSSAPAKEKFSVAKTELGTLLDNPAAKAVLEKHLPALMSSSQIDMTRTMTLKDLQAYAGGAVTDDTLSKIQADLDKLPAQ